MSHIFLNDPYEKENVNTQKVKNKKFQNKVCYTSKVSRREVQPIKYFLQDWLHRWSRSEIFFEVVFFLLDNNCLGLFPILIDILNKLASTILVLFKGKSQEQSSIWVWQKSCRFALPRFNQKIILLLKTSFCLVPCLLLGKQEEKRVLFFRPSLSQEVFKFFWRYKQASKQAKKDYQNANKKILESESNSCRL